MKVTEWTKLCKDEKILKKITIAARAYNIERDNNRDQDIWQNVAKEKLPTL